MYNTNNKLRVADVITNKEIEQWKDGDIITISAGTGKGKSYFIKNTLFSYAKGESKKILMLIHRSNCVNQFRAEIKRDGKEKYIDIMTYQAIESRELNHCSIDMSQYKYIVCDEFHYFLSDAGFNNTTDISFSSIINQDKAIKIFMSATGDDMKRYINKLLKIETINYEIPFDFSFIESLTFFNKDSTLELFAEEAIKNNVKVIFFIQSAKKAYKLYKKYEEFALFNCSKNNTNYYKYVDSDKVDNMLKNEKFDDLILITTSCMDTGVNIIDSELKHIVIDIKDIGSLIQCMGRKRNQKDEQVSIYIKTINNQQLGGMETYAKKNIEKADYLKRHNTKEFIEKYPRSIDKSNIIYDDICTVNGITDNDTCVKKVNELMYFKKKLDIVDYQIMRLQWGEFGYCKALAYKFGFYDEDLGEFNYRIIKEDNSLENYLKSMVGKVMLQVADRKELIEKINIRRDGKLIKKLESINPALIELGYPYLIIKICTSRIINGKKKNFPNAWIINQIDSDNTI